MDRLSKLFACSILLALFLSAVFPGYVCAGSGRNNDRISISNDSLRIAFNAKNAAVTALNVSGESMKDPQNLSSFDGEQLRLAGKIAGRHIDDWAALAGGWKLIEASGDTVLFRLFSPEIPFVIETQWTLSHRKWVADFQLTLQAVEPLDAADLKIVLGPGIGGHPVDGFGFFNSLYSFTEIVTKDAGGVKKFRLQESGDNYDAEDQSRLDWVGLHTRYFALLLAPDKLESDFTGWSAVTPGNPRYFPESPCFGTVLSLHLPAGKLNTGEKQQFSWDVYAGGKAYDTLKESGRDFHFILFSDLWQWMRVLTVGIMHILYAIQGIVINWGVAIIVLAILVRIMIHPLAKRAMASQRRFAALQEKIRPELREIKKLYKGGEQSARILHVYESYGVSPLAGLKPLLIVLIQVPVFIALFHLLGQAFELRDTAFLWINTLSEPDRLFSFGVDLPFFGSYFNLLPLIMTATNIISITLSQSPDKTEKGGVKRSIPLVLLAVVFFVLFYSFPSGMVLYWTMANMLHVIHQEAGKKRTKI